MFMKYLENAKINNNNTLKTKLNKLDMKRKLEDENVLFFNAKCLTIFKMVPNKGTQYLKLLLSLTN